MKLRIFADSIRFRLTRSEVARIERGETVESRCRFPGGETLTYALSVVDARALAARMHDDRIEIAIPRHRATRWAASDEISLRGGSRAFRMLIEKDFTCIEPRAEEEQDPADLYPNPKAARRRAGAEREV